MAVAQTGVDDGYCKRDVCHGSAVWRCSYLCPDSESFPVIHRIVQEGRQEVSLRFSCNLQQEDNRYGGESGAVNCKKGALS
jgi:hypothetical protein